MDFGVLKARFFEALDKEDGCPYELVARSRSVPLGASPADEAAGQGDERTVEFCSSFPAGGEALEPVE
ncbi:hypothetical protein [Streptomyces sp. NPDC059176]|uniref:hypothetical protein n=1 Tax=Streptomyces sp. NPDC059176 TaxID=3346758 RepID=UPI00369E3518